MAEPESAGASTAELLKSLGLIKNEALVYVALIQASGATATELHELSGVPRASVYSLFSDETARKRKSIITVSGNHC